VSLNWRSFGRLGFVAAAAILAERVVYEMRSDH
jgi:hypothetical protein